MLRLFRQVSLPYLRQSWGRTALVVWGIANGVTLIVAMSVINASVLNSLRGTIEAIAGPAALEVTLGIGEIGFPESTVDTVRAIPDVVAAVPLVRGTVAFADTPELPLELFGVDLTTEEALGRYPIRLGTERREVLRWMADPRSVLLPANLAAQHGVDVGGRIPLSTPAGIREFTVRGLLDLQGVAAAFGGALVVMDLPAAQLLLNKEGRVDQVDIVLREGADVESARERLVEALPKTLSVVRPAQRGAQYERVLRSYQALLTGLSLLSLVVGIFIVYNTTSTGAVQRAPVMVQLRVLGADSRSIFRLLMLEACVLGTLGSMIAIPSGTALARLMISMVTDAMGVVFQLRFPVEALAIDGWRPLMVGALGVAAAVFGSWFAASRAATVDPLEVMQNGQQLIRPQPPLGRLVRWWLALNVVSAVAFIIEVRLKSVTWGNFGSTLWNASVLVIAIPLVGWSASWLSRVLPRFFGPEGRIAADSLFRAPIRTGVTVAVVAAMTAIGITVAVVSWSHRRSVGDYFVNGFLASDLTVSAVTTDGGWLESPLPERMEDELLAVPGVRTVESLRVLTGQIYGDERIAVAGFSDSVFDPARYPSGWYRAGDPEHAAAAARAGTGAIISTSLADRFGLGLAGEIELDTPTGRMILPIVGVVRDYISDRGTVFVSRSVLSESLAGSLGQSVQSLPRPRSVAGLGACGLGGALRITAPPESAFHARGSRLPCGEDRPSVCVHRCHSTPGGHRDRCRHPRSPVDEHLGATP